MSFQSFPALIGLGSGADPMPPSSALAWQALPWSAQATAWSYETASWVGAIISCGVRVDWHHRAAVLLRMATKKTPADRLRSGQLKSLRQRSFLAGVSW